MSLEEYIERFLLSREERPKYYKSKYDMGNSTILTEDDCQYTTLARDVLIAMGTTDEAYVYVESFNTAVNFYRSGGLIDQVKKYVDIDLLLFDIHNKKNKREIYKILFFLYMLNNGNPYRINMLEMLSKPTMENIDNSYFGWKTSYGLVIKTIKTSLEKEISLPNKKTINDTVRSIISQWDILLDNARILMDFPDKYGCCLEKAINQLKCEKYESATEILYKLSPIEMLYLRIIQLEQRGQIEDIIRINSIQIPTKEHKGYDVSLAFVNEMKELHWRNIPINGLEEYLNTESRRLAKYIFLDKETDKEKWRSVRNNTVKIVRWLKFCERARPLFNFENNISELLVVSCLQAVFLDSGNETYPYKYHAYEKQTTSELHIQAALKNDDPVYDFLQIYWVRKVTDRWYANIGRYGARKVLREFEKECDNVLLRILTRTNVDEMVEMHNYFFTKVNDEVTILLKQASAINAFEQFLCEKKFGYIDKDYQIRYMFLHGNEIADTLSNLIEQVDYAISETAPEWHITLSSDSSNGEEKIECDFTLLFDYENRVCTMNEFVKNNL